MHVRKMCNLSNPGEDPEPMMRAPLNMEATTWSKRALSSLGRILRAPRTLERRLSTHSFKVHNGLAGRQNMAYLTMLVLYLPDTCRACQPPQQFTAETCSHQCSGSWRQCCRPFAAPSSIRIKAGLEWMTTFCNAHSAWNTFCGARGPNSCDADLEGGCTCRTKTRRRSGTTRSAHW